MKKISIITIILGTLLAYVSLHLPEEAIGNFPALMAETWGIPNIGYGRWLFHNVVFFVPTLVLGILIFSINPDKFLPFGIGVSFWGGFNFFEHIIVSIHSGKVYPGLFSAIIFAILIIFVIIKLKMMERLKLKIVLLSIICAISYWMLSIGLIMLLAKYVGNLIT